jgi:SlyX protein
MDNLIKKLEEQIAFLQYEVSQISDELYSQQQEALVLKKKISNFERKINELENIDESTILMNDKKPPHY